MREIHRTPGRFVWHELVTSDVDASQRFYGELLGWQVEHDGASERAYAYMTKNGQRMCGLVQRPGPHVPPHVLGFVSVADVADTLARAREHRAAVLVPPMRTPIGQAAVLQDPQGAALGVCRADAGDDGEHDAFAWQHLSTSDPERAAHFYANVLAWRDAPHAHAAELRAFALGEQPVAGLIQAPQGTFAHWLYCVGVEQLGEAREAIKQLGGAVVRESISLTALGELSVIQDSVGTILGLFERTKE